MRAAVVTMFLILGGLGTLTNTAFSAVVEGPVVNPANQHTYYLLQISTWTSAESEAALMGGHLATIRNQAEQEWVYQGFGFGQRDLWIGFVDQEADNSFAWANGEPTTYTNWYPGEPNHANEQYAYMDCRMAGMWFDTDNDNYNRLLFGVVEIVPEVSSMGTLFVLLCCWMSGRRGRHTMLRYSIGPVLVLAAVASVRADVLNMSAGLTSLEMVTVGNPGNAGELAGSGAGGYGVNRICGAVGYTYKIGKYEVTAGQYTEFLNKVAGVDTYGLYNPVMSRTDLGLGILRSGGGVVGDPYTYSVTPALANRPLGCVSYWDACRFTNWLHNGQPTGDQGPGTTETGAYTLNGCNGTDGRMIQRNTDWKWAVTSEDEWYKAAYHKNIGTGADYWDYPTATDTPPTNEAPPGGTNSINASFWYGTDVGAYTASRSPYGTFDQGGNLWEWTNTVRYKDPTYSYLFLRGGSSWDGVLSSHAGTRNRIQIPDDEFTDMGFRVVQVPEPATLLLLAVGGLAMMRRR
jgi:formylglycine-generating enzyme